MKESVSIETITPAEAKSILEDQEARIAKGDYRQRKLNEKTVNRYANDMRRGHWRTNGQGLEFDESGNMLNGRHRLWAVSRANVPVKFTVFRGNSIEQTNGLPISLMDTIDCGRSRSVAQQLTIDGVPCATMIAATTRTIGLLCTRSHHTKIGIIPTREILAIYGTSIKRTFEGLHSNARIARGFVVGPLAMYRMSHTSMADQFSESYHTLSNLDYDSPVMALTRYFKANKNWSTDGTIRAFNATALALYHYHAGNSINSLRHSEIGADWLRDLQAKNVKKVIEIVGQSAED